MSAKLRIQAGVVVVAALSVVLAAREQEAVRFSTYLGGSAMDVGSAVAIAGDRGIYVVGHTMSDDFPVRGAALGYQGGLAGLDAFVAKYNASGDSVLFATYVGGSAGEEIATAVAVDDAGRAYVGGSTSSSDFPTREAAQTFQGGDAFGSDAFVARLAADGSAIEYASYFGGSGDETITALSIVGSDLYIAGTTTSTDFPVTAGAFQVARAGQEELPRTDAFVAKLAPDGSGFAVVWATYLGGSGDETPSGVVVDAGGGVWVVGTTGSDDFPVASATHNPLSDVFAGPYREQEGDAFIARLTADGSALDVAAYLGGNQDDQATGVATDGEGRIYVTGWTKSNTFPTTTGAYRETRQGTTDRFVMRLRSDAGSWVLDYATRFGSPDGMAMGRAGLVVESDGGVWIAASESSHNLPTVGALQPASGGGVVDGFLAHVDNNGAIVDYASYLGGAGSDVVTGLALRDGTLCAVGGTSSPDFPTSSASQPAFDGPAAVGLSVTSTFLTCFDTALIGTSREETDGPDADEQNLMVLHATYPDPAARSTTFRVELAVPAHVTVRVYDVIGRHQATVVDQDFAAGTHDFTWDAGSLPSGAYFYVAEGAGSRSIRKMLVLR